MKFERQCANDTFPASFWLGYTQEASISLPDLSAVLTVLCHRCKFMIYVNGSEGLNARRGPRCNHTVKLEGYYFTFIITLGHIFLTR